MAHPILDIPGKEHRGPFPSHQVLGKRPEGLLYCWAGGADKVITIVIREPFNLYVYVLVVLIVSLCLCRL